MTDCSGNIFLAWREENLDIKEMKRDSSIGEGPDYVVLLLAVMSIDSACFASAG